MGDYREYSRREYLRAANRWSSAVVTLALGGMVANTAAAPSSWTNASWVNRYGGGWANGGTAWVNGGGGGWANHGGWINGVGGWVNRGGSWANGGGGSWVNRYGGGGWINR